MAAYMRVSTADQADSGLGLAAQLATITEAAERLGWEVTAFVDEGYSGGTDQRPALQATLDGLASGEFDGLVAAKLDRLSRSVVHLGTLLETAEKQGWRLVLLDFDVDTSKPTGRLVAHVLAAVADFERQRIRERTREALAQARRRGVQLGRPVSLPGDVVDRIVAERNSGATLAAIAERLNEDGVPTAQGGERWWPSTVGAVVRRAG